MINPVLYAFGLKLFAQTFFPAGNKVFLICGRHSSKASWRRLESMLGHTIRLFAVYMMMPPQSSSSPLMKRSCMCGCLWCSYLSSLIMGSLSLERRARFFEWEILFPTSPVQRYSLYAPFFFPRLFTGLLALVRVDSARSPDHFDVNIAVV